VQRHAEVHLQQPRRHHGDPRAEIPVVHVDVIHLSFVQQNRITSAQPGMRPCLHPSQGRFLALKNHSLQKAGNSSPSADEEPGGFENNEDTNRL